MYSYKETDIRKATICCNVYSCEVVYLFDESIVELVGAASDASQMGASWHQACLALECSLPLLPLFYSPPPSSSSLCSFSPPRSVQGETRTVDVQTTQLAYSLICSCQTVIDTLSALGLCAYTQKCRDLSHWVCRCSVSLVIKRGDF